MLRPVLQLISALALLGTILPSVLFFADLMTLSQCTAAMLVATIVWFVATPLWMGRARKSAGQEGFP